VTPNEDDKTQQSGTVPETSPGEMILTARERASLSVEKLAQQLRLDVATVEALESDAYERLAAPLFVRGYLRNVAKVLDLDATRLIERYDRLISEDTQPELARVSQPEDANPAAGRAIRIGSAVVAVLTLVLAFAWWQGEQGGEETVAVVPEFEPDVSEPPAVPEPPVGMPAPGEDPATYGIDDMSDATLGFSPANPGAPAPGFDGAPLETTAPPGTDADDEAELPAPVPASGMHSPAGALKITPAEEAWIQVTDATGARLYFATAPADRIIELDGVPPFELVIGNADNVEVSYLGEAVPLESVSNAGVARLELGEPADEASASPAEFE